MIFIMSKEGRKIIFIMSKEGRASEYYIFSQYANQEGGEIFLGLGKVCVITTF